MGFKTKTHEMTKTGGLVGPPREVSTKCGLAWGVLAVRK